VHIPSQYPMLISTAYIGLGRDMWHVPFDSITTTLLVRNALLLPRLRRLTNHRSTSGLVKSPTSQPSVSSRSPSYSSTCRSSLRSASAASSGASSPSAWPRHSPSHLPPSSSARPSASHGNSGMASTRASASTTIR
jgi:hypothetical protein